MPKLLPGLFSYRFGVVNFAGRLQRVGVLVAAGVSAKFDGIAECK